MTVCCSFFLFWFIKEWWRPQWHVLCVYYSDGDDSVPERSWRLLLCQNPAQCQTQHGGDTGRCRLLCELPQKCELVCEKVLTINFLLVKWEHTVCAKHNNIKYLLSFQSVFAIIYYVSLIRARACCWCLFFYCMSSAGAVSLLLWPGAGVFGVHGGQIATFTSTDHTVKSRTAGWFIFSLSPSIYLPLSLSMTLSIPFVVPARREKLKINIWAEASAFFSQNA